MNSIFHKLKENKSKNHFMKENKYLKEKIVEAAEMPKDVTLKLPVLTLIGQSELLIENYIGIIEYTDTMIRIQTKTGPLKLTGSKLIILYYTNDDMKIKGHIQSIEFKN